MIRNFVIIFITVLILCIQCSADEIYPKNLKIRASLSEYDYNSSSEIEQLFKENLSSFENIIYTIIPMGVVVSINGYMFYDEGKDEINPKAFGILNVIAELIKTVNKPCLVESNTLPTAFKSSNYMTNWELSVVRANNIANYLISKEVQADKIRANGFGEIIPFTKNSNIDMRERIDFIIFNYEDTFRQ